MPGSLAGLVCVFDRGRIREPPRDDLFVLSGRVGEGAHSTLCANPRKPPCRAKSRAGHGSRSDGTRFHPIRSTASAMIRTQDNGTTPKTIQFKPVHCPAFLQDEAA